MLKIDQTSMRPMRTDGGYSKGIPVRDTYVQIGDSMQHIHGVLYEPMKFMVESTVGVIIIHSDDDYSTFPIGPELARRGYRCLCGQVSNPGGTLDDKILDIGKCVQFMKRYEGIRRVVLLGHSGGASLMSAYQSIAENGVGIYQNEGMIYPCAITERLQPADGIMLLDSNWGNGSMTLLSMDPAVIEEGNGIRMDPELDLLNERNGYDPKGCHYSEAFIRSYNYAQKERNNRILKTALDRFTLIQKGKGKFVDDEPFIVVGGAQFAPCNKLIPQDTRLVAHTKGEYELIHGEGSITREIIHCLRKSKDVKRMTASINACFAGTVKGYLSNRAVMADDNYQIREDGITGIGWNQTYNCTPGNVKHITAPMLIMGMTGSYEYLAAEVIYENAASTDKTICFSEGSGHNFFLQEGIESEPGEYGDPAKNVFDKAASWMGEKFA